MPPFVIAEAGVNHNGSLERAIALVDAAAEAGADAVKFQTFRAEALATADAEKAAYQAAATGGEESQREMLRALELPRSAYADLARRAADRGLRFLSTPFDAESASFLIDELGLSTIKVSSGDLTNGPFLLHLARRGVNVILSTGMGTLGDVESALAVLAFGYAGSDEPPGQEAFREVYASAEGRQALERRVTLLHCTTGYPTPIEHANVRAIDTLRAAFGLRTGLSDHTLGRVAAIAAVARGAEAVEKHFTLDRSLHGPDHAASLEPGELEAMVRALREVGPALGSPRKAPAPPERPNVAVARKSLVARRPIAAGERIDAAAVAARRPGTGLSPMRYWEVVGRRADRDYQADDLLAL